MTMGCVTMGEGSLTEQISENSLLMQELLLEFSQSITDNDFLPQFFK